MNPGSGENLGPPGYEAPQPASATGVETTPAHAPEAEKKSTETAVGKQQPPLALPPQSAVATPPAAQPAIPLPTTHKPLATASLPAADVNLIEKQWVNTTKKVVKANHDDPYKQKNEVSLIKADYVKKRFKKVIPTAGDQDHAQNHEDHPEMPKQPQLEAKTQSNQKGDAVAG